MSRNALFAALHKKIAYEAVSVEELTPNQLRVLGRIPKDLGGLNIGNRNILMQRLFVAMRSRPWKVDISQAYFLKEGTDLLVFAWRVLIQGENVAQYYPEITQVVLSSPASARSDVTEFPLAGAATNRGAVSGGRRGAGPSGTVPVGPAAAHAKLMGG